MLAAIALRIVPQNQAVSLGQQASVLLFISGLGPANNTLGPPSLGTFDIDVQFDPTVLQYSSFTFGNQLDLAGLGRIEIVPPNLGIVNVFELSLDSSADLDTFQLSAFALGTLTFDTIALGTSPVNLSVNALSDANGDSLAANITNGRIAVPEPISVVLLATALMAILVLFRFDRLSEVKRK
jgi:hypothetical protein